MNRSDEVALQRVLIDIFERGKCPLFERISFKKKELGETTRQAGMMPKTRNQLIVLKEFGSFTPLFGNAKGGGYFLILDGKGIVIDPGYNFLTNFFDNGFHLGDINAVIVTHSHDDHCADLEPLVTLMYQQHKNEYWPKNKKIGFFLNKSSYNKYKWLQEQKKCPYIQLGDILKPGKKIDILGSKLTPKRANHEELEYKNAAVGLVFETKVGTIVFSGDTGWNKKLEACYIARLKDVNYLFYILVLLLNRREGFYKITKLAVFIPTIWA